MCCAGLMGKSGSSSAVASTRSRRGVIKRCGICGKSGHRQETCPLPGASLVAKLRRQLQQGSNKSGSHYEDDRSHAQKSGPWKKKAMKAYQGTSTRVDQRHRRNLCEILDKAPAQDDESAVKWLLSMGFVQKPNLCPTCECKKIQGPCQQTRQNRSPWWFWRCSFWSCQTRLPFLTNSAFVGLRLQPKTLVQLILHYASSSLTKVVTRDDLVQAVNVGWQQGQHFLDVLTTQEAEAGELFCKTAVLSRSIECDATGLGRYYVKRTNLLMADQIQQLEDKKKSQCKAYPCHIRLLGLHERGGAFVAAFLRPRAPRL